MKRTMLALLALMLLASTAEAGRLFRRLSPLGRAADGSCCPRQSGPARYVTTSTAPPPTPVAVPAAPAPRPVMSFPQPNPQPPAFAYAPLPVGPACPGGRCPAR